jgi:hypothetical protein
MTFTKGLTTTLKALIVLAFVTLVSPTTFAQVVPGSSIAAIEEVYLAKDDGSGQAGEMVTEFRTTDIPIFCVVLLETADKVTVMMNFVAVSVAGVKADTKVVSASYTTTKGQDRVNFTGRPEGKWTPGTYRVDIFLDGKVAKNVEFEIKKDGGNSSAVKFFQPPPPKPKPPRKRKN